MSETRNKNKGQKGAEAVNDFNTKPKNAAVAIRQAIGVPESNFEAPDQRWEELEDIFKVSAEGVIQVGMNVNTAVSQPGVKNFIKNINELNLAIEGLMGDLDAFSKKLAHIHSKHQNYTGVVKTPGDRANCISIFEEYVSWNDQFKAVTLPTVLTIMDHVGTACQEMAKTYQTNVEISPENQVTEETAAQQNTESA